MPKRLAHPSILAITLAAFFAAVLLYGFITSRPPKEREREMTPIDELGFSVAGIEDFTVAEDFSRGSEEQNISAVSENAQLRLKILSNLAPAKAAEYSRGTFILLDSQYDPLLPPYPEFLTNKTGCAKEFLPVKKSTREGEYRLIPAGARFDYGLCADDLVRFHAGFAVYYCEPAKKVFQLEYFIGKERPWSDVEAFMNSFRCNN